MTAPDLTAAEARAEVEAFLGEWWTVKLADWGTPKAVIADHSRVGVRVRGDAPTYRAAVAALKQVWRDVVRPWVREAFAEGELHGIEEMNHKNDIGTSEERAAKRLSRVLKEDAK